MTKTVKNNWRLNTSLKWKRRDDITNLVFLVSEWCKNNLSSNKEMPIIWVDFDSSRIYGEYQIDENEIFIYPKRHKNIKDIIDTTIHEWVHFLQDKKGLLNSLEVYKFSNNLNPNEIEAIEIAEENINKCWKDIKQGKVNI